MLARAGSIVCLWLLGWHAVAAPVVPPAALPLDVAAAMDRARVPREALSAVVQELGRNAPPRLSWQAQAAVNPASLMKLFTTYAALDLLGPAWTWTTPVWLQGALPSGGSGVFEGDVVIKGGGDPKLVVERVWLLLRRLQQLGVREIRGDIVLDRSAFEVPEQSPADFDGEALRPYNVRPDALLLNYKALSFTFTPDPAHGVAVISTEPALEGVRVDARVPLAAGASATRCDDWRSALQADFSDPQRLRFKGLYSPACGEKQWPVAYADPARYNERLLAGLWTEMGGKLTGSVRDGAAPATAPTFELASPPLAEVIRDINKFSNNVMAQQLFLTLALSTRGVGTPDGAREVLRGWLTARYDDAGRAAVIDNGSGLSRETRVSAELLARLLQDAAASPLMPELMASLPVSGVDGTMRRAQTLTGRAHLKTGSLRDVAAVAGYLLAPSGRRYVLVGIVNHPNASAARPALEALIQWAANEGQAAGPDRK
ncbi:MAG: D-alanyl-D-alanine carboxypeptidase/D-alanyl-D-alanine-endopeptidase [Burkholderiales bacterium PBB1]|nr:MAG: D-alanyl-D-alanine carboxypeptidase/D-alanyl-D-alanine-endopeptidase [Burkholderiales bacterium PBB1]